MAKNKTVKKKNKKHFKGREIVPILLMGKSIGLRNLIAAQYKENGKIVLNKNSNPLPYKEI